MRRISIVCISSLLILMSAPPLAAWPMDAYRDIVQNAVRTLPAPLQQLLGDMAPVLAQPCEATAPGVIEPAAALAIQELSSPQGDLGRGVAALRTLGCATAALNDLTVFDVDTLVLAEKDKFAVVYYGWNPLIQYFLRV